MFDCQKGTADVGVVSFLPERKWDFPNGVGM